jgi:hypothetical protein
MNDITLSKRQKKSRPLLLDRKRQAKESVVDKLEHIKDA